MESPQNQKNLRYLLISLLFLLSFFVYLPTLFNGFVYDDMEQVLGNPWIVDLTHLDDIFFSATWAFMKETGGSNYYRPLMHLGFLIEQHLFGFSPKAFHLINIILHSLNTVLLFFVASTLFRVWENRSNADVAASISMKDGKAGEAASINANYLAFAAAMIFALHPINSEVVNWVSALPELTYTLFLLAAFFIYISIGRALFVRGKIAWSVLSVILFFFALLSKETAMAFLLFIWCFDLLFFGPGFLKRYRIYIPYILTAVVYILLRSYALGGVAQKMMVDTSFHDSVLNIFPTAFRYIGKLIWPARLSVIYSYDPFHSFFEPVVIFSLLGAILIIIAVFTFRKRENLIFPFLWIIIPLLPVLYIPVVSTGGFADRYLYLPSAGFAVLVGVIASLVSAGKDRRKAVTVLLGILLVIYAGLSIKRSMVWKDSMSLWSDTITHAPDSAIVNLGLAAAYRADGDNAKAIEYYKRVVRLEPFNYKPYYNLALIYQDIGDEVNAETNYLNTIRLNPLNDNAYFNLAVLYDRLGKLEKAIHYYKETIRVNPLSLGARRNLAQAYKKSNNPSGALSIYKEAVLANPLSTMAHYNLAWSYQETGDNRSAIDSFKEAIRLDSINAKAIYGLAWVYHYIGDISQAEHFYEEATRVEPDGPDAYFNLGLINSARGNFKAAVKNFERVLEINPNYREARDRLERAKLKR